MHSRLVRNLLASVALLAPTAALSADPADVDRLTTYATLLGRAIGCGLETQEASREIGRWMDKRFPPGSSDQKTYLPIFMTGVQYHAEQQRGGHSPDSCSEVARVFGSMQW